MKKDKIYLTEKSLGDVLLKIFPNHEFVHNKQVPDSGIRNRPDYRCNDLMLIIEFDGHRHYTQSSIILKDITTEKIWGDMGYNIIRIPYFIQMCSDTIYNLFEVNVQWTQVYEHGFIDDSCILPADYCSLGIQRFLDDIKKFNFVEYDILESLKNKMKNGKHKYEVYPKGCGFDDIDKHGIIIEDNTKKIFNDGYLLMEYRNAPEINYTHSMINDMNQNFCGGWSIKGVDTSNDALFKRVLDGNKPMATIYDTEEKLKEYIKQIPSNFDYKLYDDHLAVAPKYVLSKTYKLGVIKGIYHDHLSFKIDINMLKGKMFKDYFDTYDNVEPWLTGLLLGYPIENTISLYRMN